MVQDIERGLGHGLVGVRKEEADLPQSGVAELGLERGHPGETDTVEDFPVRLAKRIVADSDHLGLISVWFEQLRSVRVHVHPDR